MMFRLLDITTLADSYYVRSGKDEMSAINDDEKAEKRKKVRNA